MKTSPVLRFAALAVLCVLFAGIGLAGQAMASGPMGAAGLSRTAAQVTPPPLYKLSAQGLAGLPFALALDETQPLLAGQTRRMQSMKSQPAANGSGLLFLMSAPWKFLPNAQFEQMDKNGNRLLLTM